MNEVPIDMGDVVEILETPETRHADLAGRVGTCMGWTTPSVTDVEVVGDHDDFAYGVVFEDRDEAWNEVWFAPDLLRLIDHGAGTEIVIADKHFVRTAEGQWIPEPADRDATATASAARLRHRIEFGVLVVLALALLLTRTVAGLGSTAFGIAVSLLGLFVVAVIVIDRWRPDREGE